MTNKYRVVLVISLVIILLAVAAGGLIFFFRMYQSDVKALKGFTTAYHAYDQAVAGFSKPLMVGEPASADLEHAADQALTELKFTASVRISSLIKNDAELMSAEQEIAGLAEKELAALKACQTALAEKDANFAGLAKAFTDLSQQRQAAFARYLQLSGGNE